MKKDIFNKYYTAALSLIGRYDKNIIKELFNHVEKFIHSPSNKRFSIEDVAAFTDKKLNKKRIAFFNYREILFSMTEFITKELGYNKEDYNEYLADITMMIWPILSEYSIDSEAFADKLAFALVEEFGKTSQDGSVSSLRIVDRLADYPEFREIPFDVIYDIVDEAYDFYIEKGIIGV
ncbi:MAG: hypothetical protein JXN64_15920 [Spirochaetes bacterium]|nr:hypothetical protein [Spirochaetota bacterium]